MYNGSFWNFKRSRYNLLGDDVSKDVDNCCEDDTWTPDIIEEENEQ